MSLTSRLKQKFFKRKPRAWHLSKEQVEGIDKMVHDDLVDLCVKLHEQQNRVLRAMVKLKQAITEITASGD